MSEHIGVLNIGGVLLVALPSDLNETAVASLQEELSAQIVEKGAHGVLDDITGVQVVDTCVGGGLSVIASVARLLGAHPVLVGIRPGVAQTLVQLGVELNDFPRTRDLDAGLLALGIRST
ncbi:STAS domain-containing protein [[Kitasatospora] papulosa]|uniref:STAS domain-containing protein n=1 Tax=Streptomyces TaxID=1883 RepID=UPI000BC380B7|nr:STAS domain-containing protein [[Kitasatospora] papulosa]MCX4417328.1 STAS domain-containing protein [[Kitasatospora] papulosa]RAS23556.1 rsbT antagonist protein RsbS [Streptomyces avidinii]TPN25809.1 STAS domain-containing protein [Mesorhizobium sp. B2-3-3]SNX80944.1 rsbT antagonist protein RsbS [Streptomyces microflavus]